MRKKLLICLSILIGILLLEKYTNWDLLIQNMLYNYDKNTWFVSRENHKHLRFFFYEGLKIIPILIGIYSFSFYIISLKSYEYKKYKKPALLLLLSIILVPSIISGSKLFTNVYCPNQLDLYGGDKPFVRIIDAYPNDYTQTKQGKCFPAGHATTGFCLMALYFCFKKRRNKIIGLSFGLSIGFITGLYQMLRGQHFLSHNLFTMVLSFMIILIINYFINQRGLNEKS